MVGAWKKFFKGEGHNSEFEAGFREMFKDIARERARLGGDWTIAGVLFSSKMREMARILKKRSPPLSQERRNPPAAALF